VLQIPISIDCIRDELKGRETPINRTDNANAQNEIIIGQVSGHSTDKNVGVSSFTS